MSKKPSPNDRRGIVKNPNNQAYTADRSNRVEQGHRPVPPPPPPPAGQPVPPKK